MTLDLRFAVRLALRELRHGFRRVGAFMASISLGVAALVSIHSFRADVARSVQEEADVLMGANARMSAERAFPDSVTGIVDSLAAAGVEVARVTTTLSMVLAPSTGDVRLMQVRGVEGGYPFYGTVRTEPEGMWGPERAGGAVVDPAVLSQLGVGVGDSLAIGSVRVPIVATVQDLPTDLGFQTAAGPRVHVPMGTLMRAGLLQFGSLARYEIFLRLPERADRDAVRDRYRDVFESTQVRLTLAEEQARRLSNAVRFLGRFLALVGLGALLLGGVGVASAIHVYVRERSPSVAVLRCIGAGEWTVFASYLIQAALLGASGAVAGVVVGLGVQQALPGLLQSALPVAVRPRPSALAAAAGLGIGVWVALIFALLPLLRLKSVPPLQALRADVEPARRRLDPVRMTAWVLLAGSVLGLCLAEAPEPGLGIGFAAALAGTVGALAVVAVLLMRLARALPLARAPYPIRQGVANLFRPHNQTLAVTLALGFGAFVLGSIVEVERNLVDDLRLAFAEGRPNVLFFDVQPDQVDGVLGLLPAGAREGAQWSPLIPSRLERINGRTGEALRSDTTLERRPARWALRREYRNTQRAFLGSAEELVAGRWWGADEDAESTPPNLPGVSLEVDLATDLAVGIGDTLTWNVAGRRIDTVVRSLRRVDWERLEPNFFVVFEPGSLDGAPGSVIMVARIPDPAERTAVLRRVAPAYPNVSALDFSRVQEAVDAVLSRVRQAVGFLGAFSAVAGLVVLVAALATSRLQRLREAALLRTLGASRRVVRTVFVVEFLALATLATLTGLLLAEVGARVLMPAAFEMDFRPHPGPLALVWGAVVAATLAAGWVGSREVLRRPPLVTLREVPE